jgi:hypothetical protein
MQHVARGKKLGDVLAYLAALVILAAISTLAMVFYSIRNAYEQLPERLHCNTLTRPHED